MNIAKLQNLLKNRTAKNAGYLIIGKVIQMAFSLVISLLTARYLGPSNYGLINYAGAYTGFFAAVCTLGINNVLVKEFIDHPGEEGMVIGTTLGLRAISSILSAAAIAVLTFILDADEPTTRLVVILASIGMIFQIAETFNYWFQSRLESKVTATATLIAYLISSAYKVYLLIAGKSVEYFVLVSSLDYLCLGIILYVQYKKRSESRLSFSWQYGKKLFKKSYHFILSGLMISIYAQTDKIMLKHMIGQTENGYYATAAAISTMWCFILSAVIDSMYPSIMEATKADDGELFKKRNVQLYAIVFYLSAFVSLCFTILARPIILILYGESYLPAAAPLRIITWYTAFSYLGVARNAWVVAKDRQKYLFQIYTASALANVVLNYLLIPDLGASGAAIASLAAQVFTTLVVPFFIKGMRENSLLILDAILLKGILWKKSAAEASE
jgi:O-antigen/teichoic acid export membrane protein